MPFRKSILIGLALAWTFLPGSPVIAAPIQFVFEADLSGQLDGVDFFGRVRIDLSSTTDLAAPSANNYRIFFFDTFPGVSKKVTIEGIGSGAILTTLFLTSNINEGDSVILRRNQDLSIVWAMVGLSLEPGEILDFQSPVGPATSQFSVLGSSAAPIETELGTLILDFEQFSGNDAFYSATLVPVPSAIWSLAAGLGLLFMRRKRQAC